MDAREIVTALGGKWQGSQGMAICPSHNDKNPSLSIKDGTDGRVLVKCHAGCSQDTVIAALQERDLWSLSAKVKPEPDPEPDDDYRRLRKAMAIYRQTIEAKKRVKRYLRNRGITGELPSFMRYLPRKHGGPAMVVPVGALDYPYLRGIHLTYLEDRDPPRRLYGPCKGGFVRFGIDAPGPLLIGEGLEEALTIHQLTGNEAWSPLSASVMGAVAVPASYREVIVCANNDPPGVVAGRALAERLAADGRLVRLAVPELEGEDWNDMLCKSGADHDALLEAILKAQIVIAPKQADLVIVPARQFATLAIPPRSNLLSPWLPQQGLAMVHAPRGVGKTYFALGVSCAIAYGGDFLGWKSEGQGDVLYIDGEMPANQMQERVRQFHSLFPNDSDFDVQIMTPELQAHGMPDLGTEAGQKRVDSIVTDRTCLIVVDSITTLVRTGDENTAEGWLSVQTWELKHRAQGRSVLFVHHSGKSSEQRGTSSREDVLDTVIKLSRPKGYSAEEGAVFEVHFEKARGLVGPEVVPFEARLSIDEDGRMKWETSAIEDSTTNKVLQFKKENPDATQQVIGDACGVSNSRVSQILKWAVEKGIYRDAKGGLDFHKD